MRAKIKFIGPISSAKTYLLIMGFYGLIIAIYSVFRDYVWPANGHPEVGISLLIVNPLLYGLIGAFIGAIGAIVYNWTVKYVGGVEVHMQELSEPKSTEQQ